MTSDASSVVSAMRAAYNENRWADLPGMVTPNVVSRIGPNAETVGPKGLMGVLEYYAQYSHVHFQVLKLFTQRSAVAVKAQLNVTYHTTEPGMPEAVGQTFQVPLAGFLDVVGGRVDRISLVYNYEDWLRATEIHSKREGRQA